MLNRNDWTIEDLVRVADKIREFAADPFYPHNVKHQLLEAVCHGIRHVERVHDIAVT